MDSWSSIEAKGARPGVKSESVLKAWGAEKGITVLDITEGMHVSTTGDSY